MNMNSLGVMDLDSSISPDVFGLRAFDIDSPIARMLPGSTPCELRPMLLDAKLGIDGFHDIIIDNLTASPPWRSSHISQGGCCSATPAMAEGCIQNIVSSGAGRGAPPSGRQEEIGRGISS